MKEKVAKNVEFDVGIYVKADGGGIFVVADNGIDFIIDTIQKSYTYRRWDLNGTLCLHACACTRSERLDPLCMVDVCHSVDMLKKAYGNIIMSC